MREKQEKNTHMKGSVSAVLLVVFQCRLWALLHGVANTCISDKHTITNTINHDRAHHTFLGKGIHDNHFDKGEMQQKLLLHNIAYLVSLFVTVQVSGRVGKSLLS